MAMVTLKLNPMVLPLIDEALEEAAESRRNRANRQKIETDISLMELKCEQIDAARDEWARAQMEYEP